MTIEHSLVEAFERVKENTGWTVLAIAGLSSEESLLAALNMQVFAVELSRLRRGNLDEAEAELRQVAQNHGLKMFAQASLEENSGAARYYFVSLAA